MNKHIVSTFPYHIIASNGTVRPYPYIVDTQGKGTARCIGARHGRSLVVGKHADGRYIVSKGNGLSYSEQPFLYTPEMPTDVWGLLLRGMRCVISIVDKMCRHWVSKRIRWSVCWSWITLSIFRG